MKTQKKEKKDKRWMLWYLNFGELSLIQNFEKGKTRRCFKQYQHLRKNLLTKGLRFIFKKNHYAEGVINEP